jgi:hypothetical protein
MKKPTIETAVIAPAAEKEHRANRRVKMSRPLLARPADPKYKEEVQVTANRDGLYFRTRVKHYYVGMRVSVILGCIPDDRCNSTSFGKVFGLTGLRMAASESQPT